MCALTVQSTCETLQEDESFPTAQEVQLSKLCDNESNMDTNLEYSGHSISGSLETYTDLYSVYYPTVIAYVQLFITGSTNLGTR